jgi:hypothetical protein
MDTKDKYKDKLKLDDLKKKVGDIKYLGGIIKLIDEMYPSWIQKTYKRYCNPTDMKNWATVCKTVKTTPKKIIVVDFIYFDKEKYSNILLFADLLSSAGFSIVDKYRVRECENHNECLLTVQ